MNSLTDILEVTHRTEAGETRKIFKNAFYQSSNGDIVFVMCFAQHTETGGMLVIYHDVEQIGDVKAESLESFLDTAGDETQVYRFQRMVDLKGTTRTADLVGEIV